MEEPKRGRPKGKKDSKKRKKRTDASIFSTKEQVKHEKKEELSRIIHESAQYRKKNRPRSNEEIRENLDRYFQDCEEKGQIPTVEDMALALGVQRAVVWGWEQKAQVNPERAEMIIRAKETIAAIDAKLAIEGKITPVTYIFRAKNFYGMRDQQEVVVAPVNPLGDGVDPEKAEIS